MSRFPKFEIPPHVVEVAVPGGRCRFRLATMNELSEEKAAFLTGSRGPRVIYVEKAFVMVVDPGPYAPLVVPEHEETIDDQRTNIERARLLAEAARPAALSLLAWQGTP